MEDYPIRFNYEQKAVLGVHGYMRENIQRIKSLNMPYDLVQLITIWYGTIDYIDINNVHPSYELTEDNKSMQRTAEYDGNCYHLFGNLNIKMGDIKIWRLQLLNIDPICTYSTALIGIIDTNKMDANLNGDFCDKVNNGYGISLFKGRRYFKTMQGFQYATNIEINDIIIMQLDMTNATNCTLKYKINRNGVTTDYGNAFQKIDANIQWRLAIAMYYKESIRLIQ